MIKVMKFKRMFVFVGELVVTQTITSITWMTASSIFSVHEVVIAVYLVFVLIL